MRLPDVSVLLPVRNAACTLDAALGTVRASRGVDLEIVCVDDGSSDGTAEVLRRHAARDPRIRILRTPARGIVQALNRGLDAVRAPLVARMDADDEMHPDRLALQLEWLRGRPDVALVGSQVECFHDDTLAAGYRIYAAWVNGLVTPEAIEREAFVECPVPHPTWTFRHDAVRDLGGYHEEDWPEDLDLLYRILGSGARVGKVARPLHRWRDSAGRLSRVDPRYDRRAFARAKAHFLPHLRPLAGAVVWGAGRTGRRFVKLLEEQGVSTRALIDVHPDRIGTRWRGIPILAPTALADRVAAWRRDGLRVLCAVASRGARAEIRSALCALDLDEGTDFLMVA